mgnify:CR=1 FL=1
MCIRDRFIGTVTNATRAVVAAGLTDSPNVSVNYINGVGGTFTGITSFQTLRISGGVIGEAGIITATTFSGSATTAQNAAVAYGIAGDPDIQVDKLTVNGTTPTTIKGTGVSTIGSVLNVGEFLGVGDTASAVGQAAGFIGTVRISDGDLILGGSISIGGSLVGTVPLGGTQEINELIVGAGLGLSASLARLCFSKKMKVIMASRNIEKLNIYNCLRDFNVPAAVLDEIFANEQDLNILIDAWRDLRKTGLKHDEISEKVSKLIMDEIGLNTDHNPVEK